MTLKGLGLTRLPLIGWRGTGSTRRVLPESRQYDLRSLGRVRRGPALHLHRVPVGIANPPPMASNRCVTIAGCLDGTRGQIKHHHKARLLFTDQRNPPI